MITKQKIVMVVVVGLVFFAPIATQAESKYNWKNYFSFEEMVSLRKKVTDKATDTVKSNFKNDSDWKSIIGGKNIKDGSITSEKIKDGGVEAADIADGTLTANKFSSNSCVSGQLLKYNGSAWACAADDSSGSLADGSVTNAKVATNAAIDYSKLNLGSNITSSNIANGTIISDDIADGTLTANKFSSNSCVSGQLLKYNGSAWACAADDSSGSLADGSVTTAKISDGAVTGSKIAIDSISSSNIVNGSINGIDIFDGSIGNTDLAGNIELNKIDFSGGNIVDMNASGSPGNEIWIHGTSNNVDSRFSEKGIKITGIVNGGNAYLETGGSCEASLGYCPDGSMFQNGSSAFIRFTRSDQKDAILGITTMQAFHGTPSIIPAIGIEDGNGAQAGLTVRAMHSDEVEASNLRAGYNGYFQMETVSAGAPASVDCDSDSERGRFVLDTTNNRLYVCNGATRGWDYSTLND